MLFSLQIQKGIYSFDGTASAKTYSIEKEENFIFGELCNGEGDALKGLQTVEIYPWKVTLPGRTKDITTSTLSPLPSTILFSKHANNADFF